MNKKAAPDRAGRPRFGVQNSMPWRIATTTGVAAGRVRDRKEAIVSTLLKSIASSKRSDTPYRHWFLRRCLPEDAVNHIPGSPFPAASLAGISGKRDLHNATRKYFDVENRGSPWSRSACQAFQDKRVTDRIAEYFGRQARGVSVVEAAQDTAASGLSRTADLGLKAFTMLLYISRDPQHATLGTDIYDEDRSGSAGRRSRPTRRWCSCPPTSPSTASSCAGSRVCASR